MVDLAFLKKFTKGKPEKMIRYINMYLEITPSTFDQMRRNIDNQNWKELAINAHSLKPQADFMGIQALKDVLGEMENCARKCKSDQVERLFEKALQIHTESENYLIQFLKKESKSH